jgi:AcrR family transcriptional regulator
VVPKSNGRSISTGSPRRVRRRDARRDAILRAAGRIFRDRGFADSGMRDIAEAADLSPANLYHYFRGKDEILFYCQDRALDRMLGGVAEARRASTSPAARLEQVLTTHVRTLIDEIDGASAHVYLDVLPTPLRARIVAKRDRYERAVRRLVEEGARGGAFAAPDPALVTRAMLGAVNWTVTWFRPEGPQASERIAAAIAAYLVRGVVLKPAAARRLTLV